MKTNGTRIILIVVFLQLLALICSIGASAQPDYNFSNGSLISGTDKQVNARYRFTSVKPGIDAIVTITSITGGIALNQIDGSSGFKEAFQPVIDLPAHTNGHVEFKIDFVTAGTFTLRVMNEVPATCIDVDGRMRGGFPINEYDMIRKTPGVYVDYNLLGGELTISYNATWIIGTNISTIDYPGVDTLAKEAMFSTVQANISSMTIRVGGNNQSVGAEQRLRSVYFKKFSFPNSFLAKSALLSFRGVEKNKKVELQWELQNENKLSAVIIEKSKTSSSFKTIGEVGVGNNNKFNFTDNETLEGNALYRLKLIGLNGKIEYSNILAFRNNNQLASSFNIYPSVIQSSATLNVKSAKSGTAVFELIDYTGRVVHRQNLTVQEGHNNIQLNSMGNIIGGNYLAVLKIDNNIYTQKINKL